MFEAPGFDTSISGGFDPLAGMGSGPASPRVATIVHSLALVKRSLTRVVSELIETSGCDQRPRNRLAKAELLRRACLRIRFRISQDRPPVDYRA